VLTWWRAQKKVSAVKHLSLQKICEFFLKSSNSRAIRRMDDDDARSVAWSTVSQTDQLMFTMLTNPQNIDRSRVPDVRARDDDAKLDTVDEDDDRIVDITHRVPADLDFDEDLRDGAHATTYEGASPPRGDAHDDLPPQPHEEPTQPSYGETAQSPFDEPPPPPQSYAYEEPPRPPCEGWSPSPCEEPPSVSHAERPSADGFLCDHADDEHGGLHDPPLRPSCGSDYLPFNGRRSDDPPAYPGAAVSTSYEPLSMEDETDSKRTVLMDLQALERRGVKLTKNWTLSDPLDDMLLEMRRHTLALDEQSNVSMMRDGLRMVVTGIELVNNRFKLLDLEGWSAEVCQDLEKHDQNLARIYRKYCRRGVSRNPEMEIAMSMVGSLGFHHIKRSMARQMLQRAAPMGGDDRRSSRTAKPPRRRQPRRAASPSSSDDEEPPP